MKLNWRRLISCFIICAASLIGISASGQTQNYYSPNQNSVIVSTNCASQNNCYTVKGNGRRAHYASFTSGETTISTESIDPPFICPNGSFPCSSGGDVGDVEFGTYNCNGVNPAQCTLGVPYGTIISIQDAHDATVSKNATHSSTTNTGASGNNFYWGVLDDTGIAKAWHTLVTTPGGGNLELPCSALFISKMPFDRTAAEVNAGSIGPIEIHQCPTGVLIPVPPGSPGFDLTTCDLGCIYYDPNEPGNSGPAGPPRTVISWLNVDGGGVDCTSCSLPNNAKSIIYVSDAGAEDVHVEGWIWNKSTFVGLAATGTSWFINSNSYFAGGIACSPVGSAILHLSEVLCNGYYGGGSVASGQTLISQSSFYYDYSPGFGLYNTGGIIFSSGDETVGLEGTGGTSWVSEDKISGGDGYGVAARGGTIHLEYSSIDAANVGFNSSGGTITDDGENVYGNAPVIYSSGTFLTTKPQQGTCAMSSGTTCTISLTSYSSTSQCYASDTSDGTLASKCSYSSGTVTVTAPSSNSDTWVINLY